MKGKIWVALIASFTLGLAPFSPEPHIWGKLKWLAGGAKGMTTLDYFDLLWHGSPFIWLIFELSKSNALKKKT